MYIWTQFNRTGFVDMVQTAFRDDTLLTYFTLKMVTLLPKRNRYFRDIGITEVLWNTISGVNNHCVDSAITYHGVLHSLRSGRCMGTASLESNLLHQLTEMRQEVLQEVLMDLRKAYDAPDWERHLEIILLYVVGARMERLLRRYCEGLTMVVRAGRYS